MREEEKELVEFRRSQLLIDRLNNPDDRETGKNDKLLREERTMKSISMLEKSVRVFNRSQ